MHPNSILLVVTLDILIHYLNLEPCITDERAKGRKYKRFFPCYSGDRCGSKSLISLGSKLFSFLNLILSTIFDMMDHMLLYFILP